MNAAAIHAVPLDAGRIEVTRDPDADLQVCVTNDGNTGPLVALTMPPAQAVVLAKLIAQADAASDDEDLDFKFDRDAWRTALVDLLVARARTGGTVEISYARRATSIDFLGTPL